MDGRRVNVERRAQLLRGALEEVLRSAPFARKAHRPRLMGAVQSLLGSVEGVAAVYESIADLTEAGIFEDTPWEDPARLIPRFVGGTLRAGGETTQTEILSDLRMLRIAEGRLDSESMSADEARSFLEEALALNLDLLFEGRTEESRLLADVDHQRIEAAMAFLREHISLHGIKEQLAEEIRLICHQRPAVTTRVRRILEEIRDQVDLQAEGPVDEDLRLYLRAVDGPSPLSREHRDLQAYRQALQAGDEAEVLDEAEALAASMRDTGLVCPQHAVLVREYRDDPEVVGRALALQARGLAELEILGEQVVQLIEKAVHPETSQSVYGLSCALERGILSRTPVQASLSRLLAVEPEGAVAERIQKTLPENPGHSAGAILVADVLKVLGQPLGVGQGGSPTCQSARGISLWSQHAPGKLLEMVLTVVYEDDLTMRFEGELLHSSQLPEGLSQEVDYSVDAVSVLLVPHLDRIYNEMMKRAAGRGDDPHRWVNPAMYGHWIPTGFATPHDPVTGAVRDYEDFVRTFYAAFHPDYNGGHDLIYPCPTGLYITSADARLLGFHAISLLRVARTGSGEVRAYFLNPNEEGRQDWGQNIVPTVHEHGERHGESSLPFEEFVSRTYAFHYNASALEDSQPVDDALVQRVVKLAQDSWGRDYIWQPAGSGLGQTLRPGRI